MYFYFINLLVLALLVMLETIPLDAANHRYVSKRLLVALGLGYLCFLAMFRGISVGNDTYEYSAYFYRVAGQKNLISYIRNARFEPGYILLNWLLSRLCDDPQILIIVSSVFSFWSVGRFLMKHSRYPTFSVYLFFTLMSYDFFLCAIRQELAIAVLLFAYDTLLERKCVRYMLLVLLAAMFHYSALIFVPVYFLVTLRRQKRFYAILLTATVVCLVCFQQILGQVLRVFSDYGSYSGSSYFQSGIKSSLLLYLAVYLFILITGECVTNRNRKLTPGDQISFRLVLLLPVLCVISFNAPIFTRFLRYFQLFIYIYFPNVLLGKEKRNRMLLLVLTMILSAAYALLIHVFRTPAWFTSYPYSFFWND